MKGRILNRVGSLSESIESLAEAFDLYILFIDLCDSTQIKQFCLENQIPDSIWITRQMIFLSRTGKIIQSYGGKVIKTIGDEVMANFDVGVNPFQIIRCCLEVFQTFQNLRSYNKGPFIIDAKAAIDYGACYDGHVVGTPKTIDPIGTCVDRCARIGKFASKKEIVFSQDFKEVLDERHIQLDRYKLEVKEEELKGLGRVKFYKVKIS
jgi:class 3 adenylate cyclase